MLNSIVQTISVAVYIVFMLCLFFQVFLWWMILFFPLFVIFIVPYLSWIWLFDNAPKRGGRPLSFMRGLKIWDYITNYFPARLILQEQLDPSKTYLFAYNPHGVWAWGLWANMLNDSNKILELLEGIKLRILTLDMNFLLPFYRDVIMGLGFASVSRESCNYLLSKGISIVIVIGGAEDTIDAKPGTNKLKIKNKKGFIRMALKHGANLVPVFTFGENELFDQIPNPPGSRIRRLQTWMKHKYGFVATPFWGRGHLPAFPRRHEIVTIIGSPIEVQKKETFNEEDVEELHEKYIDALVNLYSVYADKYAKGVKLEIE